MSEKKQTLLAVYNSCKKDKNFDFDNEKVKEACTQTGFKNPFDVTKIDNSKLLPDEVRNAGYCVVHLGGGRHRFMKIAKFWYHKFEKINQNEHKTWEYEPSILNHTDTSESNIISFAYNQKIIRDFLYGDICANPKIYMSRRTKKTISYRVGKETINTEKVQMELDATFEHEGEVTVLEAKNGFPDDFAVYQIFLPCLDYYKKNISGVKKIRSCFLARNKRKHAIRLYLYTFSDPDDMKSIQLIKKAQYNLTMRER